MGLKIQKEVFDKQILNNVNSIIEANKIKKEEYKGESLYSTFELSEKLGFLSVEKLLFIRGIGDKINRISSLSKKGFVPSVSGESVFETCDDLVNYSALLLDYLYGGTDEEYQKFFKEICEIFQTKNGDYSNTENDAIANFNQIEDFGLGKTEDGMLGRVAIKIQRIANFLNKNASKERIREEIIDLAVYTLIFSNYLKIKQETEQLVNNVKKEEKKIEVKEEDKKEIKEEVKEDKQTIEEIFPEEDKKTKKETKKKEITDEDLGEIGNLTDDDLNNIIQNVDEQSEEIGKMVSEKMIENEKKKEETSHDEEVALEESIKEDEINDSLDISDLV